MDEKYAIKVNGITKIYKLFDRNIDRVRDALGLSRRKLYKEHYALNDVSFEVRKGEAIGIIGSNGAGKSTLLKIITGVLNPTGGNVEINGRISALLELGAGFNMEYTGLQNVYLNGTMSGFSKEEIDARLDSIIEFADIGDFINQPVKTYSSGMFVRLAFAVAINIDPEILIVDEALSVGDVFFQNKCFHKFEEFRKAGKTIIFVSHDLSSIRKYCDKAVLLDHGKIIGQGLPSEVIDLYKRVLTGNFNPDDGKIESGSEDASIQASKTKDANSSNQDGLWKDNYPVNPSADIYGDELVKIIDYAIVDEHGKYTNTIEKGTKFSIKVRIKAFAKVNNPIVAYTFKTLKGTDITGSNTMYEDANLGIMEPGDERVVTFTQNMDLQGGVYLISFGCTRFESNEFKVYQRLYDIINLTVVSDKDTVGFYDMNSVVDVQNG